MSLETLVVALTGHGVEKSLNVIDSVVRFLPVVPFTEIQEAIFTVENSCDYPVEFFWHHLDNSFQAEDQVINTLLDYYEVEELLLPLRKPGEPLPQHLINFYNDLLDDTSPTKSIEFVDKQDEVQLETKRRYADSLDDTPYFLNKTRDPVRELFESIERKSAPSNNLPDPARPERKVCIIFHGAPFAEYQETACRSARVLNVPVLSIDKAIMEAIALGDSSSSIRLRQAIDDAYQNYIDAHERHKERLAAQTVLRTDEIDSDDTRKGRRGHGGTKSSASEKSSKSSTRKQRKGEVQKSPETEEKRLNVQKEAILLRLPTEPDPSIEFNKIPASETLETLDPLSRYEYKVQAISQLERIVGQVRESPRDKVSARTGDRSARSRKDPSFLGMGTELFAEVLVERLSAGDFKRGFVLQSLESNFLRISIVENLILLLKTVGHAEYFLFVTFLNSLADYNRKVDELRQDYEKTMDRAERIRDIDGMSLSEYDLLDDEDKKMYLEAVLPGKRARALLRRAQFTERMSQRRQRKVRTMFNHIRPSFIMCITRLRVEIKITMVQSL
ncbi:hydrocephalus-inducing protein homolog [Hylaeus volcanicus]|uniref:hydrocephalus-inducing protein homolog n=1 Tax=Hylaeus volcanicus TaxID=313075 RepID=UPI0023B882A6|nr:hydrocephalus-inducing protein homolog [Hylaeus volcanicus]